VFESGRAAFLRHMLGRQGLFATPAFRQLEPMARNNLASELRALVG
jgi:predicted metal-dependent HD superfamily phosphohydrolase